MLKRSHLLNLISPEQGEVEVKGTFQIFNSSNPKIMCIDSDRRGISFQLLLPQNSSIF